MAAPEPPMSRARLKPSTEEALIEQLEWMRQFDLRAIERYFPEIAESGVVAYSTLDALSPHQADALRFQLTRAVRFAMKQEGRRQAQRISLSRLAGSLGEDAVRPTHEGIKQRVLEGALEDLCSAYSMANPLALYRQ